MRICAPRREDNDVALTVERFADEAVVEPRRRVQHGKIELFVDETLA
jgi:hypothetical protein